MRSDVLGSFGARALTLPLSALAGLASTSILVSAVGADQYGYIALIGTIFLLLPFADLGLGASVVNAFAAQTRETAISVLVACTRTLLLVAGALVLVAFSLSMSAVGTSLLGVEDSADARVALLACVAVFALGVPLGLGQRVLLGLGKNALVVTISAIGPMATTAAAWAMVVAGSRSLILSVVFPLGLTLSSLVTFVVALRIARVRWRPFLSDVMARRRDVAVVGIRATAAPMFVISVGLPVALQSDRLVLAHQATPADLAAYSVAAQLYAPLWAIASTTGTPLWPMFTRLKASPLKARRLWQKAQWGFLALSLGVGVLLFFGGPLLATAIADGEVLTPTLLYLSFAGLLVAQATHLPNGMLLTDSVGLRFQAVCVVAMVAFNIALSVVLADKVGASGPVIASAIAVIALQSVPAYARVWFSSWRSPASSELSEREGR